MTEQVSSGCSLCSDDYSEDLVETITSASAAIGVEMSLDAFREWLIDDARHPEC